MAAGLLTPSLDASTIGLPGGPMNAQLNFKDRAGLVLIRQSASVRSRSSAELTDAERWRTRPRRTDGVRNLRSHRGYANAAIAADRPPYP
jgi:hypothetical protein